ncbi:MAG: hypothetical protein PHP65_01470 [Bacilli bacterium]|nr:hypothetical protein [Bacilli bacterium]
MDNACFLCNSSMDITLEHVFPKWLQKQFNIHDQKVTLINGSSIKYSQITIPCCKKCNNQYLSVIENKVKKWIEGSAPIDELTIFKWMLKILYGLNFKETLLKNNIKDKNSKPLVTPGKVLSKFSLRAMLLSIIDLVEFKAFVPYSIFIHEISNSSPDSFFYFDEPTQLVSSMQLGKIAINCSFQDEGIIKKAIITSNPSILLKKIDGHLYAEIACMVLDMKKRMEELPNYTIEKKDNILSISVPEPRVIYFAEFDERFFNNLLSAHFMQYFQDLITIEKNGQETIKYSTQLFYFKGGKIDIF